ncbi:MAG: hypothetical protein JNL25_07835 [Rhodospirillaceae bacterium]|nr:hypothetical protein [Rhodospirillaceae bacterium]
MPCIAGLPLPLIARGRGRLHRVVPCFSSLTLPLPPASFAFDGASDHGLPPGFNGNLLMNVGHCHRLPSAPAQLCHRRNGFIEGAHQAYSHVSQARSLDGEPAYRGAYGKAFDSLRRREDEINLLGERPFVSENAQSQCITAYNQGVDAWNMALRAWAAGSPGASEQYVNQANYYWMEICRKISGCVLATLPANISDQSGPWMMDPFNMWGKGLTSPLPHYKPE